eukprot:Skav208279  [mRNA]  locus=scaffold1802:139215:163772:+ [translate_table: standard]
MVLGKLSAISADVRVKAAARWWTVQMAQALRLAWRCGSGDGMLRLWLFFLLERRGDQRTVTIILTCREGNVVKALGDGTVQILAARQAEDGPNYIADCRQGKLSLSTDAGNFVLHADQSLEVPSGGPGESPRCSLANKAYYLDENESVVGPSVRKPRLFVVHGNGEAEELLSSSDANAILEAAKADTTALVVGPETFEQFKCRDADHARLDGGVSRCSAAQLAEDAQDAQAGTVTERNHLSPRRKRRRRLRRGGSGASAALLRDQEWLGSQR